MGFGGAGLPLRAMGMDSFPFRWVGVHKIALESPLLFQYEFQYERCYLELISDADYWVKDHTDKTLSLKS